jgi:integrase/recombinase XerD
MTADLRRLIAGCNDELEQRNYAPFHIVKFNEIWEDLSDWCGLEGITLFSEEIGNRYCDETVGGHTLDTVANLLPDRHTLRAVRLLISLMETGDFEFRSPRKEKLIFSEQYREAYRHFLDFCRNAKDLSESTMESRERHLYRFDKYLEGNGLAIEDLDLDAMEAFFATIGLDVNTIRYVRSCVRDFLRFMFDNGYLPKDHSPLVLKGTKKVKGKGTTLPTTYTEAEIKRVIAVINRGTSIGKRDYLVILLAAEYGWRASDITRFNFSQIDWERNEISFFQYKTGNPVVFPLLASVGNAVIDYLRNGRPDGGDDVIIVSHMRSTLGKALHSPTIHSIVTRYFREADIPNWRQKKHGPHALRHSLATNMLKKNVPMPLISTVLGHQSTETTKVYVGVDIGKLRECGLPIPAVTSLHYKNGGSL